MYDQVHLMEVGFMKCHRHSRKRTPAERWDDLNNAPITSTCAIRLFLMSSLTFCPPGVQPPRSNTDSKPKWGLFPPPFWAGWHMDEMRNRRAPYQTNQLMKPCPVHEYHLWRGDMHLFKLLCLAWWQCKHILKSIACCWPAVSRRSGHTERPWPLILCGLLEVTQDYMDTFTLIFHLDSNSCLCQNSLWAGKREQSYCPPLPARERPPGTLVCFSLMKWSEKGQ